MKNFRRSITLRSRVDAKNHMFIGMMLFLFCFIPQAYALELPRKSPAAEVSQVVGLTKVHVTYFSPGAKDRKIWGQLVPYGKLWRTGANGSTKISFSHDVKVGGKSVKAGIYSIFIILGKESWTFLLNKKLKIWGTYGYKKEDNVLEIKVKPSTVPHRERLTFLFANTTDTSTELQLEWAGVRVSVSIATDTKKFAMAGIKKALARPWRPYFLAGRYLLESGDLGPAKAYLTRSIKIQPSWWNHWYMAVLLSKQGKIKDALQHAKLSTKLGANDRVYKSFYANRITSAIAKWSKPSSRSTK